MEINDSSIHRCNLWICSYVHSPRLKTKPHTGTDIGFRWVPFVPPDVGELDQQPQAQGLLQQQWVRLSHSQRSLQLSKRLLQRRELCRGFRRGTSLLLRWLGKKPLLWMSSPSCRCDEETMKDCIEGQCHQCCSTQAAVSFSSFLDLIRYTTRH